MIPANCANRTQVFGMASSEAMLFLQGGKQRNRFSRRKGAAENKTKKEISGKYFAGQEKTMTFLFVYVIINHYCFTGKESFVRRAPHHI
ncbi:MAG: hypothetical protein HUJ67_02575 [Ruminiclostridium sp.]|nr:hypothetical protein [Ruminiclostridium sp.]